MSYSPVLPTHHTSPLTSPAAVKYASRLSNGTLSPMEPRQPDYQSPEHGSAPQYNQPQDHRGQPQEYGMTPTSARTASFPEYLQQARSQPYTPGQGPPTGGLPQSASSSDPLDSMASATGYPSLVHDRNHSNLSSPIDPSIATSPTYPPQASPYSPYSHPDIHNYPGAPGVYGRPDWANQGHYSHGQHPIPHYGHPASSGPPSAGLVSPVHRPPGNHAMSTVYSFVPIPGAQQHKRPRRRYEEIERMYKCGWAGCEKAYGTLNHLNAHVTMQSHGVKRTPEEFKEIRKEWKQKKKDEEAQRKADDDRNRQQVDGGRPHSDGSNMGAPQLPPISYPHSSAPTQPGYGAPSPAMVDSMHSSYPSSPYPPAGNSMYSQQQPNGQPYPQH